MSKSKGHAGQHETQHRFVPQSAKELSLQTKLWMFSSVVWRDVSRNSQLSSCRQSRLLVLCSRAHGHASVAFALVLLEKSVARSATM